MTTRTVVTATPVARKCACDLCTDAPLPGFKHCAKCYALCVTRGKRGLRLRKRELREVVHVTPEQRAAVAEVAGQALDAVSSVARWIANRTKGTPK